VSEPCLEEYNADVGHDVWFIQAPTACHWYELLLTLVECSGQIIYCGVPILFFMGDTLAHDKLCCLQIHLGVTYIFWMCNIHKNEFGQAKGTVCAPRYAHDEWSFPGRNILQGNQGNGLLSMQR